jgi:16S rRNA C967 or C1407 C5-methylase (RsmB/RsmF family)
MQAELSAGGGAQDAQKAVRCLAIAHSHPSWLAKRWIKRFGALDAEELMAHNNRRVVGREHRVGSVHMHLTVFSSAWQV